MPTLRLETRTKPAFSVEGMFLGGVDLLVGFVDVTLLIGGGGDLRQHR